MHTDGEDGGRLLRVAVRDGYDVISESADCGAGTQAVLDTLWRTPLGALPATAREAVRAQVTETLADPALG